MIDLIILIVEYEETNFNFLSVAALSMSALLMQAAGNPFLGRWALTTPDGQAGWLEVKEMPEGYLDGSILWIAGSVVPVDFVSVCERPSGKKFLLVYRMHEVSRKDENGKVFRIQRYPEVLSASVEEDITQPKELKFSRILLDQNGKGLRREEFKAVKMNPIPSAPDLSKVKYEEEITLFNGKDLEGWRLTDPNAANGWFAQDGLLICDPKQEEGKPHKYYGNLRTDKEFEDFNLTLKAKVDKGGNSGIYLRGVCEIQVADTCGKPLDPHNMGALYSRITPSEGAEKPAGEWQEFDITYCDEHVTVILNGVKIIDNQPVGGCTGGALWSDITRPGPIYLQGDHTGVAYKDIKIKPIKK